jgi:hypothetical protein
MVDVVPRLKSRVVSVCKEMNFYYERQNFVLC